MHRASTTFERKRSRHDADGERTFALGDLCHDRRRTRAGAAALAGGDEHHVGTGEMLLNLIAMRFSSLASDFRIAARAETAREFAADVDLETRVAHDERLCVGVDRDEVDSAQSGVDHSIHGVHSAATDSDHFDDRNRRVLRVARHDWYDPQLEPQAQPLLDRD